MADIKQITVGDTTYNIEPVTACLPLSGGTIDAGGLKAPLILKGGTSNWNEGLRILPAGNWSTIMLGGKDINETEGTSANSWSIHNNDGKFYISKNGSDYASTKLSNTDGTWRVNDNDIIHTGNIGSQSVNYAKFIKPHQYTTSTGVSSWTPSGTGKVIWGQKFVNSSISTDTGDLVLTLRPSVYNSGTTELCMHIDGDYYSNGNKVIHSGNIGSQNVNYANSAGSANSVALKDSSGTTTKATMQYNSTEDCIEFIFA